MRAPGNYRVHWDGRDDTGRAIAAGIYYMRLQTPTHHQTRVVVRSQ